jgi:hypothetical protein
MHRSPVVLAVLLTLASCTGTPAPVITGQFADSDLEQIKLLVSARADIKQPIHRIQRQTATSALVQTGPGAGSESKIGDVLDTFTVYKRHGKWTIDQHSFTEDRIVVTSQ